MQKPSTNRRNLLAAAAVLLILAPNASAQVAGKDFIPLSPPQPGGSHGQVEVIEFFSFACPHCGALEPHLKKWRAAQPKDVVFRRVPVSFGRPEWAALGRLYITLNAMGLSDKLDGAVFDAIHKDHLKLADEKVRDDWLARHGVDVKKFHDTWRSFGVDSMAKRADQLTGAYKVTEVPSLFVNGRYLVQGPTLEGLLKNTDLVVAKARADK